MTTDSNSRLGRGLQSMVNEVSGIRAGASAGTGGGYMRIPLADIKHGGSERSADDLLTSSVKKYGVLQPVLVTRTEDGYVLLAGARRLDAARASGLADVPALVIPPERAGNLDVFIEENLNRADLEAPDRIRLRDRWMKETGGDEEQALLRIPDRDIWQETETRKGRKNPATWMIAAGVMAVVTIGLLLIIFTAKPIDKRTVVIPVEFVERAAEPAFPLTPEPVEEIEPDVSWMEAFLFPRSSRTVEGTDLIIVPGRAIATATDLTPVGNVMLNQLAAIALTLENTPAIDVLAGGSDASLYFEPAAKAAAHLIREGIPSDRVRVRAAGSDASAPLSFRLFSADQ
ncbi:MAG TPA: ParB N-terminal domain-containing protein [Kiritimatiellia bacterium]|mgnify:CR=1 FL=1|nr:ParB N-terminal domain-containing protein [Kiritimatiellia bacterium]